jgi:hypothetical protein
VSAFGGGGKVGSTDRGLDAATEKPKGITKGRKGTKQAIEASCPHVSS